MWFCIDERNNVAVGFTALKAWEEYQREFDDYPMHMVRLYDATGVTPNKLTYAVTPVETKG